MKPTIQVTRLTGTATGLLSGS